MNCFVKFTKRCCPVLRFLTILIQLLFDKKDRFIIVFIRCLKLHRNFNIMNRDAITMCDFYAYRLGDRSS